MIKSQMREKTKDLMCKGVLQMIYMDRMDEKRKHRQLIAQIIHLILAIDLYQHSFEKMYLSDTQKFFTQDAQQKFNSHNLSSYLSYVELTLEKEVERVAECLDISTKQKLLQLLEKEIIDSLKDNMLSN
mmetsp:Transcript_43213/g.41560  ORF Transcript_43213/g.41560 Transcript_43213/m.41560 type:complete len:129 (+) Transcript_43213:425-811(+)